ncbi:hypothetical protein AMAG_05989 [Allomyces macrogynus ATCC 38327]|uniref:Origin recognition complex subunit 2 n=1 Tax=Allomyces macrogynus (strain ATCC 38327) TaxID=578462 RepID=A0A0L0SDZ5_ALLM3|nr:hypothetical protein AMAG_05989 [Allomyces macrogynus ATCC 38327]|eukprot:KNE60610.1 hypothetical protein AMAG_05989 [Allomyces macrogynus ATCC 38327]
MPAVGDAHTTAPVETLPADCTTTIVQGTVVTVTKTITGTVPATEEPAKSTPVATTTAAVENPCITTVIAGTTVTIPIAPTAAPTTPSGGYDYTTPAQPAPAAPESPSTGYNYDSPKPSAEQPAEGSPAAPGYGYDAAPVTTVLVGGDEQPITSTILVAGEEPTNAYPSGVTPQATYPAGELPAKKKCHRKKKCTAPVKTSTVVPTEIPVVTVPVTYSTVPVVVVPPTTYSTVPAVEIPTATIPVAQTTTPCIETIVSTVPVGPLFLVVHNIDAPGLRADRAQTTLAHLASHARVRVVATADHIHAALQWDYLKLARFNWLPHHVATFAPYHVETAFENTLMVKPGVVTAQSARTVLQSLPPNSRECFRILATHALGKGDQDAGGAGAAPAAAGMSYQAWFSRCREQFLVSEEANFRTIVTEFKDHQMVATRRVEGVDVLAIPLPPQAIESVLESMG